MEAAIKPIIIFENMPVLDEAETNTKGRDIYKDEEIISIMYAGKPNQKFQAVVTQQYKEMYPREYKLFKENSVDQVVDGTRIENVAFISKSQVLNLKALHIRTVEELASCDDEAITNIGLGGRDLVEKAKAYVKSLKDSAVVLEQKATIDRLMENNSFLQSQIDELKQFIKENLKKVA